MKNKILFLDHVAIRVTDPGHSARWYQDVLGLKHFQLPDWGDYPVMMLAGDSGIALFPGQLDPENHDQLNALFHVAFRVKPEDFPTWKAQLKHHDILFNEQQHPPFISLFFRDPDGYHVELTAKMNDIPVGGDQP